MDVFAVTMFHREANSIHREVVLPRLLYNTEFHNNLESTGRLIAIYRVISTQYDPLI